MRTPDEALASARPRAATLKPELAIEGKGAMLRGYLLALQKSGLLAEVRARVSPATAALLDDPPPVNAWIAVTPMEELLDVVAAARGPRTVRALGRDATRLGLGPVMRPAVEGFLRLFGVSPATIFARLGQISASVVRGVEYEYQPDSERGGTLVVRYPRREVVGPPMFIAVAGSLEIAFEMCEAQGVVVGPEPVEDGARNAARYRVSELVRR